MELVSKRAGEVLHLIAAVNDQGYQPASAEIDAYGMRPEPYVDRDPWEEEYYDQLDIEPYSTYLHRLHFVDVEEDKVSLSPFGRAVLQALHSQGRFEVGAAIQTVLGNADPFAYAKAMAVLADVNNALVVDPYIKLEGLFDILPFKNVTRILTSSEHKDPSKKAGPFAAASNATQGSREIRIADISLLHDRYFIPISGPVLMVSTSMNSIGRRMAVIVPLAESASRAVRDEHEAIWSQASPVAHGPDGLPRE
jgi:hypothetical protein